MENKEDWATFSMKEYIFWRNGMTPEEFEDEQLYYWKMCASRRMDEYVPLWKQKEGGTWKGFQ